MKPFLVLVLAALTLAACDSLGDVKDQRNDPGQRPYPASPR